MDMPFMVCGSYSIKHIAGLKSRDWLKPVIYTSRCYVQGILRLSWERRLQFPFDLRSISRDFHYYKVACSLEIWWIHL